MIERLALVVDSCRYQLLIIGFLFVRWSANAVVEAILPTGALVVSEGDGSTYLSISNFGARLPSKEDALQLPILLPTSSADGCGEIEIDTVPASAQDNIDTGFILVLERSNCSFDSKAANAQAAGASALVVINTLQGIYAGKQNAVDEEDYDCDNGQGWLKQVTYPAWNDANTVEGCINDARCSSNLCVLTNETDSTKGTKVCCAWDLYITMGYSDADVAADVMIPTLFATVADGQALLSNNLLAEAELTAMVYDRPRSEFNVSSVLLWALGVFTVMIAAYRSAADIRYQIKMSGTSARTSVGGWASGPRLLLQQQQQQQQVHFRSNDDDEVNIGVGHAIFFIFFASAVLMLLFFFELTFAVTLMYCLSASTAVAAVLLTPLIRTILGSRERGLVRVDEKVYHFGPLGTITRADFAGKLLAGALALGWFCIRNTSSYAWILQDIFGCCLCVLFLSVIKVNNVKVMTWLFVLAFVYDIFWVFISPLLFSGSVMVDVATGGDATKDPTYCEKYPTDSGCVVESLPMLLQLPRIGDYQGGYTMLGLGDIALPGLLLSFALRYDTSVRLPIQHGYFLCTAVGYALGLMMANVAVYAMQIGQPALLYLVPCTLGLFCFLSYMDCTLRLMWEGPPSLNGDAWESSANGGGLLGPLAVVQDSMHDPMVVAAERRSGGIMRNGSRPHMGGDKKSGSGGGGGKGGQMKGQRNGAEAQPLLML